MRLVLTLLVRNEEDILATNIDYHLSRGVEFIIATDNRSEDRTPEILERYRARGVLRVIEERSDDYDQQRWVTRMARLAAREHGADWVINADADEFWWPKHAASLPEALRALPPEVQAGHAERHDFLRVEGAPGASIVHAMTTRKAVSLNAHGDPLHPKVCHRAHGRIHIGQGNHHVYLRSGPFFRRRRVPSVDAGLEILHFPLRSYEQFERKIALGGAAYTRNTSVGRDEGSTWRMLYRRYLEGELSSYFAEQVPSPEEREEGLAEGRFVLDERLLRYLDGGSGERGSPVAPGAPDDGR